MKTTHILATNHPESTDDELVGYVLAGRTYLYEEIVRRYQGDVTRVVRALLYNDNDTEDIVQQVFVDAYVHLADYQQGREFGAWIRTIARNAVRMELRRKSRYDRRLRTYYEILEQRLSDEEDKGGYDERVQLFLKQCMERLAPQAATVIRLRYADHANCSEIAEQIGTTPGAVRNRLSRARTTLRDCVGKAMGQNETD